MRRSIFVLALSLVAPLGAVQSSTFQPAQLQQDFDVALAAELSLT